MDGGGYGSQLTDGRGGRSVFGDEYVCARLQDAEISTGAAPLPRGPGHGVWDRESGRNFTYAFQFFRFNADGSVAGTTKARREVTMNQYGSGYSATAAIEVYNPAGTLVATAGATETAVRFE